MSLNFNPSSFVTRKSDDPLCDGVSVFRPQSNMMGALVVVAGDESDNDRQIYAHTQGNLQPHETIDVTILAGKGFKHVFRQFLILITPIFVD